MCAALVRHVVDDEHVACIRELPPITIVCLRVCVCVCVCMCVCACECVCLCVSVRACQNRIYIHRT